MADASGAGIIGRGINIKGELQGDEDLVVEGRVEGNIKLRKHLIVESTGVIDADVETETITIKGQVNGNMVIMDKVEITDEARVVGDIKAPRVEIADGAHFKGMIDMDVELPEGVQAPR